jgi:hypothetical protein
MLTEVALATAQSRVDALPALIEAGTPVKAAMVGVCSTVEPAAAQEFEWEFAQKRELDSKCIRQRLSTISMVKAPVFSSLILSFSYFLL